jgi:hypothetical protein
MFTRQKKVYEQNHNHAVLWLLIAAPSGGLGTGRSNLLDCALPLGLTENLFCTFLGGQCCGHPGRTTTRSNSRASETLMRQPRHWCEVYRIKYQVVQWTSPHDIFA